MKNLQSFNLPTEMPLEIALLLIAFLFLFGVLSYIFFDIRGLFLYIGILTIAIGLFVIFMAVFNKTL